MRKRRFKRVMAMVLAFALVFTMNTGAFASQALEGNIPQSAAEGVQVQEKTEGAQIQAQVPAQTGVTGGVSQNESAESGQVQTPEKSETQPEIPESEPAESAAEGEEAAGTETVSEESALAVGGVSEDSAGAEGDTEGADEPIVTDEGETEEVAGAAEKYIFDDCKDVVRVPAGAPADKQWTIKREGRFRDTERVEYQKNSEGGLQYIRIYGGNLTITCGANAEPANLEIYPFPIPTDIKMGDGVAAVYNSSYDYNREVLFVKDKVIDFSSASFTLMRVESTSYNGVVLENDDNNNYVPAVRMKSGLTGDLFNQDGGKALNGYTLYSSDGVEYEYGTKKDYYYYDKENNKIYPTSITLWKEQEAPGTNDWGAYWDNDGNLYVSGNEAYEYVAQYYEDTPKRSGDVTGTLKKQKGDVYAVTNTSFRRSDSVYVYARSKSKVSGNDTYYTSAWSKVKKPEELPNYSYPFYFKYNKTIKLPVNEASDKQWTFTYNGTPGENEYVMLTDSGKEDTLQKFDLNSENVTITGGINADPAELNTSAYTYIDGRAVAVGGGRLYSIYGDSRLDGGRSYTLMARKMTAAEDVLENVSGNETVPAISQNSNATGEIYKCSDGSRISKSTVLTAADNKHIKSGAQITGDYLYFDKANNMVSFASVTVWDTQQTPSVAKDDQLEAMYDMSQNNILIFGSEGYEYKVQKSGSTAPKRSTGADGVLEKYEEGQYWKTYELEKTGIDYNVYVRRAGSSAGFKYPSDWSAAIRVAKPQNVELAFNRASGGKINVTYPGKNGTLADALSVTSTNSAGQGHVDVYVVSEAKISEAKKILSENKPGDYAMVSFNNIEGVRSGTDSGFLPGKYLAVANFIPDEKNIYSAEEFATAEVSVNKAEALTDVRFKENPAAAPGKSVKYIKAGSTLSYNDLTAFVYDSANGRDDTLRLNGEYVFVLEGPFDDQVITKNKPASINELYNGISYKVYVSSNGAELKEGDGKEKEDPKGFTLTDGREGYTASLVVVKNPDLHLSMSKTGRELYYESAMGLYEDNYNEIMGKLIKFTFEFNGDNTELGADFVDLTYSTDGAPGSFKKISEIETASLNAGKIIYVSANAPALGLASKEPVYFEIEKSVIDIELYNDAHEDYDFLSHKWGEVKEQTYSGSLKATLANGESPVESTPYGKLGGNRTYAFGTVLNGTGGTVKVDEVNKNAAGDYPVYLLSPVLRPSLASNYEISGNTVKGIWRVDAPYDKAFYFNKNAGKIRLPLGVPADQQWVFTYTGEAEDYYVRYTPPSGTDDNTGRFVLNGQDVTVEAGKNADAALLDTTRNNFLMGDTAAISVKLYASGRMMRYGDGKNDLWQDTYRIMPVAENAGEVIENVDGHTSVPAIRQKAGTSGFLYVADSDYPIKSGTVLTAEDNPVILSEAVLKEDFLYYDEESHTIGYAPVTIWAVRDKPDTEDDESLYAGWDEARENIVIRGSEDYEYLILKSADEIPDRSTEASGTLVKSGSIYSRTEEKEAGDYKVYVRHSRIDRTRYSSDWSDAIEVSSPKDVTLTFDNAVNDKIEFDYQGINKTLEDKLAVTSSNTAGLGSVKVTVIKDTTDNRKTLSSIKKAGKAAQDTLEKIDGHKYHTDKEFENGKYIAVANFIPDDQNVCKLEKIVTADVVINKAKAVAEVRFTGTLKNCHGEILNGDEISFLDFKVLIEDKANNSYETLTLTDGYSIVLSGGTGGADNGDYVLNSENTTVSVNEFNGSRLLIYVRKDDAELKEMSDWSENPGCYELVTGPDSNYETITVLNKTGDHITITKKAETMRYETAHTIIGDNENDVIGSFVSVRHGTAPVIDLAPGNLKFTYSLSENTGFGDISNIKNKLNAGNTIYVSANSPKLDLSTDKPVSFKIEKSVISVNLYNEDHPEYDFESYKGYEDDVKEFNYSGKVITTLENGETPAAGTAYGNIGGNGAHNFSSILSGSSSTVKVDNVNCNIAGDYGVYITPAALNGSFSGNYILKDTSVPGIWQVKDSYMVKIVNADTGRVISDKNIVLADNPDYTVPASIAGSFAKWYLKTRSGSRIIFDVNSEETDIIPLSTKNDDGSITFHLGILDNDIKSAGTVILYASNIINAVIDQTKTELKVAPITPVIYTGLKHVAALDGSKNKNLMADINLSVTLGNSKEELTYGVDYKVSYKNNVDAHNSDTADIAKTPKVIITGIGDYKGLKTEAAFTILKADLSDSAELTINTPYSKYTDKGLSPKVTLKDTRNSKKLTQGKDFELKFYDKATGKAVDQTAYSKTSSAQKFIVVAEARSDSKNYTGSTRISDKDAVIWGIPAASKKLKASKTLNTIKYDASKYPDGVPASAFAADAVVKAGSTVLDSRRLTFELYDKDKHLIRDRLDTSTILKNAKDAGTYYLKIAVNESDPLVDGVFYEPVFVKVNYKGTKLKNLLRLGDNSKKFAYGTAQGKLKLIPSKEGVTVNAGSILVTYYSLNDTEVYRYGTLPLYSGKLDTFESGAREWTLNNDYMQYMAMGSYTVRLSGARQYEGEDSLKYTINAGKASDLAKSGLLKVNLKSTTVSYDASGERFKDNVVVTLDGGSLSRETDYTVSYRLTGSGTANMCSLTVKGKNRFTGSITTGSFIVKGAQLDSSDVKALITSTPASAKEANVQIFQNGTALKKNKDYVVSKAVDGVCTAEGLGYFAGSFLSLNVPVCEGEVRKVEFMPDATGLSYNEALRSMPVPVNVRVTYKDGSVITISEDAIDKYFYTCYEYNNKRFALSSSDGEDTGHTGDAVISSTGEDKLPIGKNMTMLIIPKSGSGVEKLMPSSSISSLEDAIKYRGAATYKCKYKISITEK